MMTFLEWNDAIAAHFFREASGGRTIYLYVTQQLLHELGDTTGDTVTNFVAAMKAGPSWATRSGLCQKAIQSMANWRTRQLRWPPYVGYLALFVLAAGHEGDFAPHAYYPRLRELLGEAPTPGQYPSFHRMLELWSDLEQWANIEKQGGLGVVRLDIAGSWLHVGLPVAQTILTETERQHLQQVFLEGGLDSEDPPPDAELASIIRAKGAGKLRPRTLSALTLANIESDYTSVLLDRILEELESWTDVSRVESASSEPIRGTLLFSLQLDSTARLATLRLHVRLRHVEVETIEVTHDGVEYACRLLPHGHSTALRDTSHRHLDGAQFDWLRPITLATRDDMPLRMTPSSVRVFTDGSQVGVSGFIEARLLDPSRPFAVAVTGQAVQHVRAWGAISCVDFRELDFSGLPIGWALFTATRATSDSSLREHVPQLSFSRRLRRIRLEGGLRLPGATQYHFRFAPPLIRLEGASESAEVRFNDATTVSRNPDGTFSIPDDLLEEDTVSAVCEDAGISLRRLIYLRDQLDGRDTLYLPRCYTPAGALDESTPVTVMPNACGVPESYICPLPPAAPLIVLEPGHTAMLIGAQPGQVVAYQPGVLLDWEPVWAIVRHRRSAAATFVGRSPFPPNLSRCGSHRSIRQWKDVLWHQRKRIAPPAFEPERILWLAYQDAARHA